MLLVERGGCDFSWKYKNAINYGASALLVSDFHPNATEEFKALQKGGHDGALSKHIPTFEFDHEVGESIRKTLKEN